jgi:hypothetical protein
MAIPKTCSPSDLAVLFGCWTQQLRLRRVGRGEYDTIEAVQAYIAYREAVAAKRVRSDGSLSDSSASLSD